MDPGFLALLRCPSCEAAALRATRSRLDCGACAATFDRSAGFVDLLDAAHGEPTASTSEQRFMESELVARLYERFWRPGFVRLVAGKGAGARAGGFASELFIHKNSLAMEDRRGPWLDLSCGPGLFTRAMAAAAPDALTLGVDISRPMLEVAVKRAAGYANAAFVRADAHRLPIASDRVGGVNNAGALHAYDDPEQVFSEVLRVLRPGGVYVGSTFAQTSSLLGRITSRVTGIRRFHPGELRAWLSRIGFVDFDELPLGGAFIFRARKP